MSQIVRTGMGNQFFGREKEMRQLNMLLKKPIASLVVVKGRRRIGKSRLIKEFGKSFDKVYTFSGLFPTEKTTLKDQLDNFGWQFGNMLGELPVKDDDWNGLFFRLAQHARSGRVLILLDEITWMSHGDPNFLGKLKNAWDDEFKKNPKLVLVLCGSVSAWIDKNILNSTGYFGRISLTLTLEELSLPFCNQFWVEAQDRISAYEKFKILSITGGVPKYLEEIHPSLPAEENIKNLCFEPSGLLFNEFQFIFTDIFSKRSLIYKNIVECLINGVREFKDICKSLNIEKSGTVSEYLDELVKSSYIRRDYTWNLKTGRKASLSQFRVSDNYLRFYLKCIEPNKDKIEKQDFTDKSLMSLPGWEGILSLQFENLVLNNRKKIMKLLGIVLDDVINDNPFFQTKTSRQEGCQIDYMIQTRFDTLYVCEIKFSKHPLKTSIIDEVQEKIRKIKAGKHISFRPVLIHVNGVSEEVIETRFFSNIIDFGELLNSEIDR